MGKSQETLNKKENEKKRLKKQREKAEKKEFRKTNAVKGASLEDMMAYVDENGNISDTPPDPKKKIIIRNEDIQISVQRRVDDDPADLIRKGVVTFFNDSKGYGFIRDNESKESIFVHANALSQVIKENDKVVFTIEKGPKGFMAAGVKIDVPVKPGALKVEAPVEPKIEESEEDSETEE